MGETAAPSLSRGMRRGQNSPVDKSSEKTSPGTPEREKSFPVPGKALALPIGGAGVCVGLQLYPLPYALSLGPYATMVFHRSFYRAQACSNWLIDDLSPSSSELHIMQLTKPPVEGHQILAGA